jgi:hypothetical protein
MGLLDIRRGNIIGQVEDEVVERMYVLGIGR